MPMRCNGIQYVVTSLFRFENYWVDDVDFLKVVDLHWNNTAFYTNAVRAGLKS
jgi:hypothetical protein